MIPSWNVETKSQAMKLFECSSLFYLSDTAHYTVILAGGAPVWAKTFSTENNPPFISNLQKHKGKEDQFKEDDRNRARLQK